MAIQNVSPGQAFRGNQAYRGGNNYVTLTAAQGTNPLLVKGIGTRLCAITNTQATAQSVTISLYDCNTTTSPATNGVLIQTIATLQPGTTFIDFPVVNGIVVVASAAITGTVHIQFV